MSNYIKLAMVTAEGRVMGVQSHWADLPLPVAPGYLFIRVPDDFDSVAADSYYEDGQMKLMPQRPSQYHEFDYKAKQWVDPRTLDTQWPVVRRQRDALLAQSDWTQLPDVPLATKETWAIYRQALRDVTLQPDPFSVVWPVRPDQYTGIS